MKGKTKIKLTYRLMIGIITGLVTGSISGFIMQSGGSGYADVIFNNFADLKQYGSFFELTYYTYFPVVLVLMINYFNGYSLLTGFLKYIISFCLGSAVGLLSVILYNFSSAGIYYSVFVFIPFSILFSAVIILSLREADKLSRMCKNMVFNDEFYENKEKLLKEYIIKLILLLSVSLIFSLLNSVINCIFFKFFTLLD